MAHDHMQKINPLHLAYSFEKQIEHNFRKGPYIATLELSLNNMIQHQDALLNCHVEALTSNDVNEQESFSWYGKTVHRVTAMKTNEIRKIKLTALITEPGVYNLNSFHIKLMTQDELLKDEAGETIVARPRADSLIADHHYIREVKLPDEILVTVDDKADEGLFM